MTFKHAFVVFALLALFIISPVGTGLADNSTGSTTGSTAVSKAPSGGQAEASSLKKAPKMVINAVMHNFGVVQPETDVKYDFIVENQGSADLVIDSVTPG